MFQPKRNATSEHTTPQLPLSPAGVTASRTYCGLLSSLYFKPIPEDSRGQGEAETPAQRGEHGGSGPTAGPASGLPSARPALTFPANPARERRALLATSEAASSVPDSGEPSPSSGRPGAAAMTAALAAAASDVPCVAQR